MGDILDSVVLAIRTGNCIPGASICGHLPTISTTSTTGCRGGTLNLHHCIRGVTDNLFIENGTALQLLIHLIYATAIDRTSVGIRNRHLDRILAGSGQMGECKGSTRSAVVPGVLERGCAIFTLSSQNQRAVIAGVVIAKNDYSRLARDSQFDLLVGGFSASVFHRDGHGLRATVNRQGRAGGGSLGDVQGVTRRADI